MSPLGSAATPLVIVAMGMLGIILSFLVSDRKKSLISLVLAGVIILTGVIQLASQSITRLRWDHRMNEIQRDRQKDLEELRQKMKDKMPTPPAGMAPAAAAASNKKK
jgi:hypothetical protein